MDSIRAPQAWDIHTGSGASGPTVCVIDSGININHPDLAANIVRPMYGYNAITNTEGRAVDDDNSHGSHCAGEALSRVLGKAVPADARADARATLMPGTRALVAGSVWSGLWSSCAWRASDHAVMVLSGHSLSGGTRSTSRACRGSALPAALLVWGRLGGGRSARYGRAPSAALATTALASSASAGTCACWDARRVLLLQSAMQGRVPPGCGPPLKRCSWPTNCRPAAVAGRQFTGQLQTGCAMNIDPHNNRSHPPMRICAWEDDADSGGTVGCCYMHSCSISTAVWHAAIANKQAGVDGCYTSLCACSIAAQAPKPAAKMCAAMRAVPPLPLSPHPPPPTHTTTIPG
eukprot:363371-Chlamydomonas_euryale.AAC.23